MGHVDPDLVGAACVQGKLQQGPGPQGAQNPVMGAGGLSVRTHLPPGRRVPGPPDGGVHRAGGGGGHPVAHRQVRPAEVPGVELPLQPLLGMGVLSHRQQAGGALIQTVDGVAYTRAGSFTLDNEGYLCLSELGRVLDREGNPIQLPTDKLDVDAQGNLSTQGGEYLATLGVFMFPDNGELERTPYGLFTGEGAQLNDQVVIHHKWVERSNVNMIKEMVNMMTTQRALQSAAQLSKIYDQVINRAVNDIGRLQ